MDGSSNGLAKLLPRSIAAKRRRNRASSVADTVSSNDDVASRGKSITSHGTNESDRVSNKGSAREEDENNDLVSYDSDVES